MMQFHWGFKITFLLESLKSSTDKKPLFFFGLFISFLFGFIPQYLKLFKKKLMKKQVPKSSILILEGTRCFLDCLCMLLLMTFNWNVVLCVIAGQVLGFYFGLLDKNSENKFGESSWVEGDPQASTLKGMEGIGD